MTKSKHILLKSLLLGTILMLPPALANTVLLIGTGDVSGLYYPTGNILCRLAEQAQTASPIHCSIESTAGSLANLEGLRNQQLDLAIIQSDVMWRSYLGQWEIKQASTSPPKKFDELRLLFPLYPEPFTVVTRSEDKLTHFKQLKDKNINVSAQSSGAYATLSTLMEILEWKPSDITLKGYTEPRQQAKALCNGEVDAIIYVMGHPNRSIRQLAQTCPIKLLPIEGSEVDNLIQYHHYYHSMSIAPGYDSLNTPNIATFGVNANLVTTASLPEPLAYEITKTIYNHLKQHKFIFPPLNQFDPDSIQQISQEVPLHDGAKRFFTEEKLLPTNAPKPPNSKGT